MNELPEPMAGLVRDHRLIEEMVGTARAAIAKAAGRPDDADLVEQALDDLRDLDAFAEVDLTVHIAKEEDVLFPALLEAAETRLAAEQGLPALIDDLVAQHDEVRDRNAEVRRVLDAIDHDHDEVRVERSNLNGGLQEAAADPGPAVLSRLHDTVKKLDWILQGHFLDEEDNLFEPAADWFDTATLASLTASMAAIEAANR